MIVLPLDVRHRLRANHGFRRTAEINARHEPDPRPALKLFNPLGAATWLASELADDDDTLFGLADLGIGCPELGYFSLREIASVRLPFGLGIERDAGFESFAPMSRWAELARLQGSISAAETVLRAHAKWRDGGTG
ncbi:hypothetical protein FHS96_005136 [Sphingomonas zeicaulis]|uniref:DUF2958 domain-containing protein n=1 Tax=Sphingomonas zeicaulis TaxID=1632740 RepID=UPI003D1B65AF